MSTRQTKSALAPSLPLLSPSLLFLVLSPRNSRHPTIYLSLAISPPNTTLPVLSQPTSHLSFPTSILTADPLSTSIFIYLTITLSLLVSPPLCHTSFATRCPLSPQPSLPPPSSPTKHVTLRPLLSLLPSLPPPLPTPHPFEHPRNHPPRLPPSTRHAVDCSPRGPIWEM